MKQISIIIMLLCSCSMHAQTTDDFNTYRKNLLDNYSQYREQTKRNFNKFRDSINLEFAKALQAPWSKNKNRKVRSIPDKDVPPIVPRPLKEQVKFNKDYNHQHITIVPLRQQRPQEEKQQVINEEVEPYIPIIPQKEIEKSTKDIVFMGTISKVHVPSSFPVHLNQINENGIATAWGQISDLISDNTLHDCINIKKQAQLCDWAYFLFLEQVSNSCYPEDANMSTLMHAYLFCQSGYKIRLGYASERLYLLYASQHKIYRQNYFIINDESFYPYKCNENNLNISHAEFPHERPLSLIIKNIPQFEEHSSTPRTIKDSKSFFAETSINQDLIQFFSLYPSSSYNDNDLTRWKIYADVPLSITAQRSFYGPIALAIQNMDTVAAVQYILSLVQHSFKYGYDNQIWGSDRAFFPEETLYYPYSDCEDRAILFTRILRDLLSLKCALVYSPGHLYTAVCLPASVKGHTIHIDNERYVICDPTYEGANIGVIMPNLKDKSKSAIVLQ